MGKLTNLLNKDLPVKIVSGFLGIMLWFVVLNINDPYSERKIYVELEVRNENVLQERNLYLGNKNYRRTVEIVVRGRDSALNALSGADFEAILDFSKVDSANDKSVAIDGPYYLKNDKQIEVVGISPREIPIQLENISSKELPVKLELKGVPKASYRVIRAAIEPEYISINDRESIINDVSEIRVIADINNIDRDKKLINQYCVVYDSSNKEIAALSNKFSVNISVEVGREVNVEPSISGEPAEDHIITGWKVNIPKVTITGTYDTISNITSLDTDQINIDGITSTQDFKVPLTLPEGVKLHAMENEVTITAEVESLEQREIIINKQLISIENTQHEIGVPGDNAEKLEYEILTESCKVILKGRRANLININQSILTPHIDVRDLREGTHSVQLKITVNPDIQIIELPNVEVKVTKIVNETTEATKEGDNDNTGNIDENDAANEDGIETEENTGVETGVNVGGEASRGDTNLRDKEKVQERDNDNDKNKDTDKDNDKDTNAEGTDTTDKKEEDNTGV